MAERLVLLTNSEGDHLFGTAECDPLTSRIDTSTVRYAPFFCGWCGTKLTNAGYVGGFCPNGHRATLRQADPPNDAPKRAGDVHSNGIP